MVIVQCDGLNIIYLIQIHKTYCTNVCIIRIVLLLRRLINKLELIVYTRMQKGYKLK